MPFCADTDQFYLECRTKEILVDLWRVISKPKIDRPKGFGSVEYFHRDQHCENPNPDLLAKHGVTMRAGVGGGERLEFHHVVEREYMVRLCPCMMSHCTCETIAPGHQVQCSPIVVFIYLH